MERPRYRLLRLAWSFCPEISYIRLKSQHRSGTVEVREINLHSCYYPDANLAHERNGAIHVPFETSYIDGEYHLTIEASSGSDDLDRLDG